MSAVSIRPTSPPKSRPSRGFPSGRRLRQLVGWAAFSSAALGVIIALGWVTVVMLRLERAERVARVEAAHEQSLRLALWRLESFMTPRLATEAARPYFHYLAFHPLRRMYDQYLTPIAEGEVLTPSPLLTFRDDIIRLHLQIDSAGRLSSPQLPQDSQRDLAEASLVSPEQMAANARVLEQASQDLAGIALVTKVEEIMACQVAVIEDNAAALQMKIDAVNRAAESMADAPSGDVQEGGMKVPPSKALTGRSAKELSADDYAQRLQTSNSAQQWSGPIQQRAMGPVEDGASSVDIGPFTPLWVNRTDRSPSLYYFRRVGANGAALVQGFIVDWDRLRTDLLADVVTLVDDADLLPILEEQNPDDPHAMRLASIPARLVAPMPDISTLPESNEVLTPTRVTLGVAWAALLAAILAGGFSIRAVQADAERRARFAGTVTHELRTPLTTFQLYTDLLADDMVPPERRGEYLSTLRTESHRLGHLVENVLSFARIEQGRHAARPVETTTAELLRRVEPALRRRAEESGLVLRIDDQSGEPVPLLADVDSIERILLNLVDNAAKYASPNGQSGSAHADTELLLRAEVRDGRLNLVVVDHGPGVDAGVRARLFRPFERGSDDHTQQQRGIGLGLALSRELARSLGGELRHETTPGGGATFRLEV